MTSYDLQLDLHTWWIAGSGDGDGPQADKVVSTLGGGLPYLPGRTLKGLLRDACQTWVACQADPARSATLHSRFGELFGSDIPDRNAGSSNHKKFEEAQLTSLASRLSVTNALPAPVDDHGQMIRWSLTADGRARCRHMIQHVASTAINKSGVADDQTLRTIEVVIPMPLQARIAINADGTDDPATFSADAHAILAGGISLLRQLGSSRHRGFGRVTATLTSIPRRAA
jgi:CRISPR/Cas system CSM-associated protein Csm3 (group 7 of RAMP superfamily)